MKSPRPLLPVKERITKNIKTQINQQVKARGYLVVPLFFLLSSLFLMVIAYLNRPLESSVAVLTIIVGIPCYLFWMKGVKGKSD